MININNIALNKQQQSAVLKKDGPLLVLAGAGSGKTRVITYRYIYMTQNCFVPSDSILMMTFSKKAKLEMEKRLKEIHKELNLEFDDSELKIFTFNSFGNQTLKKYSHKIGIINPTVTTEQTRINIISSCLKYYKKSNEYNVTDVLVAIDNHKVGKSEIQPNMRLFLDYYNSNLMKLNEIDFSDQLTLLLKLFKDHPDIKDKVSFNYDFIMVDEFQDTNDIQFQLITILTNVHNNICVVGDDDQSIYSWRGANPENIKNFKKHYTNYDEIKLETNYRCSANIINAANAVISNNENRIIKTMIPEHRSGDEVEFNLYDSIEDEANQIVNKIDSLNIDPKNIAVLVRNNTMLNKINNLFIEKRLPVELANYFSHQKRSEFVLLSHFLKSICGENEKSFIWLLKYFEIDKDQIIQLLDAKYAMLNTMIEEKAKKKPKKVSLKAEKLKHKKEEMNFFDLLGYEITKQKEEIKYEDFKSIISTKSHYEEIEFSIFNVIENELVNPNNDLIKIYQLILSFKSIYQSSNIIHLIESVIRSNEFRTVFSASESFIEQQYRSLQSLLSELIIIHDLDYKEVIKIVNKKIDIPHHSNKVQLMTIHNSKGLEFDVVFIPGCEDGVIPSAKSKNITEERNLFYVAMTRAKKNLYLSMARHSEKRLKVVENKESRFINEIPSQLLKKHNEITISESELFVKELVNDFYA
jgi:DNA helicase-2/ATP-dependent DNA helicase PcrA